MDDNVENDGGDATGEGKYYTAHKTLHYIVQSQDIVSNMANLLDKTFPGGSYDVIIAKRDKRCFTFNIIHLMSAPEGNS